MNAMTNRNIPTYDPPLEGGRVIDPAQRIDGCCDVAVKARQIAARMTRPLFCLRACKRFAADATILPVAEAA